MMGCPFVNSVSVNKCSYLEVWGQILFIEGLVVHFDLGESAEVVGHKHYRNGDVFQFLNRVIDAPHEHGQQRLGRTVQFAFGMLDLKPFGLCLRALGRDDTRPRHCETDQTLNNHQDKSNFISNFTRLGSDARPSNLQSWSTPKDNRGWRHCCQPISGEKGRTTGDDGLFSLRSLNNPVWECVPESTVRSCEATARTRGCGGPDKHKGGTPPPPKAERERGARSSNGPMDREGNGTEREKGRDRDQVRL